MSFFEKINNVSRIYTDDTHAILSNYHHAEFYDENKEYTKNKFMCDYGYGFNQYVYYGYIIISIKNENEAKYVVATELLTDEERQKLSKWCVCTRCSLSYFNPLRYQIYEYGCIKEGFNDQKTINDSRKSMVQYENKKCIIA